jgi:hypothetical protein
MLESPTFAEGKPRQKRLQMAQAAAYRKARDSGGKYPRKKGRKKKCNPHGCPLSKMAMKRG